MDSVHLIGAEDVARAGRNMQGAAEQISRTHGFLSEDLQRMTVALEQHSIHLDHLTQELRETRMAQLGITDQDIAETMPPEPGEG